MANPKHVNGDVAPCIRCDALRPLLSYQNSTPSHCKECLAELLESSLVAWVDLFRKGVPVSLIGGCCMGVAFASLAKGCESKAAFLAKASEAWEDVTPFVQALRARLN